MRFVTSPSFNVRRIRSIASTLLCFAILFAAEAPTVFACTVTGLDVYNDANYVYADAWMSVSGCAPNCYAEIDLTLTSPSGRSGYTTVSNQSAQTISIEAVVPLPINGDGGTWTGSADYTSDNLYTRTQSHLVCIASINPPSETIACSTSNSVNFQIVTSPGALCPITAGSAACTVFASPVTGNSPSVSSCTGSASQAGTFNGNVTWGPTDSGGGVHYDPTISINHVTYSGNNLLESSQKCR